MLSWLESSLDQTIEVRRRSLFWYDAFVVYDTRNNITGDWVDFSLVPKLESASFKIAVIEKEDWCGLNPEVQQLLFRMERSCKTVVLLTDEFAQSSKCKYILSVLEQWFYTQGEDRCIVITFQEQFSAKSQLHLQFCRCRNRWSVLNLTDMSEDDTLFFKLLQNAIAAKQM